MLGVDRNGPAPWRLGAWPCKLEPGAFEHKRLDEKVESAERHQSSIRIQSRTRKDSIVDDRDMTEKLPDELPTKIRGDLDCGSAAHTIPAFFLGLQVSSA